MKRTLLLGLLLGVSLLPGRAWAETPVVSVTADPPTVRLQGPNAAYSLLIHGKTTDGKAVDLTGQAKFRTAQPAIASVSESGLVRGTGNGSTTVAIDVAGKQLTVAVRVEGSDQPRLFNFNNDIIPLLARFGCNTSGCHGKANGQNGFKLSVFGFDPEADYAALVKESRGRRIFPEAPEFSLLLRKASGQLAHGGGTKIAPGSAEYETIRGWIAAGMPYGSASDPTVASIRVEPAERVLDMKAPQQLRVIAKYSDGREADVTAHARYQTNNEGVASVSAAGTVTAGEAPGDVAIMASYMNSVALFRAMVPRGEFIANYPALPAHNFIDGLVFAKLQKLNVLPSDLADDAEYLRRVYLDVIGTLPTPAEARSFLDDPRADKRARLVDALVQRPEFADYWALKWADLLRVDRQALGHKRAYAYFRWIRESLAANKPLDQFARELLTAEGALEDNGPANFYKVVNKPGEAANTLSQVFLGVRLSCAECHHHPFDRWGQSDYFGMQAFFAPLAARGAGKSEVMLASGNPVTKIPQTGATIHAHPLGMPMPTANPPGDRRLVLADWLAAPENPYFARNLANRAWAHFLGRGLVEPVDDVRATNPPSNPELLDALAKYLVEQKFDFRQLVRVLTASRVYQLSSRPNATNEKDEQNYSRALFKRLPAEVLLDMVSQTTAVPEKFPGVPAGFRAVQLWDSKVPHDFLKMFGRPVRASACECERVQQPSVAQVLHFLNSKELHAKLEHEGGTVAQLMRQEKDDGKLVEALYLTFYSRLPDEKERTAAVSFLKKEADQRRQAVEDLAWSMLNSLEFIFNH
ncbi:MAG: DUF1549 domain-containing protein [Planctomycetia bacterium]|nr:DUF1549 domain-containing protein [Planctomycetia bacterium]